MPAHLAARIETALAAESAHRAGRRTRPGQRARAAGPARGRAAQASPPGHPVGPRPARPGRGRGRRGPGRRRGRTAAATPPARARRRAGRARRLRRNAPAAAPAKHKPGSTVPGGRSSGAVARQNGVQYQHDGHTAFISAAADRHALPVGPADPAGRTGVLGTSRAEFQTLSPSGRPDHHRAARTPAGRPAHALNGCVSRIAAGRTACCSSTSPAFDRKPGHDHRHRPAGPGGRSGLGRGPGCSSTTRRCPAPTRPCRGTESASATGAGISWP